MRIDGGLVTSLIVLALGCGGTMETGTVKRPVNNKPAENGTCPVGRSLCGKNAFRICADLQNDPNHCGTCDRVCSPGIACQTGVCQQIECKSGTVPFSGPAFPSDSAQTQIDGMRGGMTINEIGFPITTVADLSGDGWPDKVTWEQGLTEWRVSVYLSDAVGALHLSTTYASSEFYKLFLVDYDRDSRPDPPSPPPPDASSEIYKLIVVDYDGDGSPDILLLGQSLTILANRGDGVFGPPGDCRIALERFDPFNFVAADFNRDGHVDFAFSSSLGRVDVMLGLGYCEFSPIQSYATAASSVGMMGLRAADMNGDGQLDLVGLVNVTSEDQSVSRTPSPSISDRRVFTLLGNPDGTFRAAGDSISLGTTDVSGLGLADVTGDQRPDIVVSRGNGQIQVWENACQ